MTGVQILAGVAAIGGLATVLHLIGCELERETVSLRGSLRACGVPDCWELGVFTASDGTEPRCVAHEGAGL